MSDPPAPTLDDRLPGAAAGKGLLPESIRRPLSSVLGPLIGLAVVLLIFGAWKPSRFLTADNVSNVVTNNYHFLVAAVGATFVIITAGIDLSVGSTMALACVCTALGLRGVTLPAYDATTALCVAFALGSIVALCVAGRQMKAGAAAPRIIAAGGICFLASFLTGWVLWYAVAGTRLELPDVLPGFSLTKTLIVAIGEALLVGTLIYLRRARRRLAIAGLAAVATAVVIIAVSRALAGWRSPAFTVIGAFALGATLGAIAGLINGGLITSLGLPAFVVSLATLEAYRGLVLFLTGGMPVSHTPDWSGSATAMLEDVRRLHYGEWLGLTPNVWIALAMVALAVPLLHFTILGRYAYAIGSNERTARLCGVPVERYKTLCYVIAGACAGIAGVMMTAKFTGGQPSEFAGAELTVIAAVVIGGTSLFGGEGTIVGTLLGLLMLGFLYSGCVIADISSFVQRIFIGGTIVLAAALDRFRHLRR
jgi:ribose/xylose/arabinose/galactoside ABC-type transport system permease subunit